jgi:hypothetical protein
MADIDDVKKKITETMTNLDIVSLRSDVTLSKPPGLRSASEKIGKRRYVFIWRDGSGDVSCVSTIDLVLIDPQSVGKRTHDLMNTVNAKKRWKTICWRVNKYLK